MLKTITLLHPFSAKAIGLKETDLYYYHSKPHENVLRALKQKNYKVEITYFTGKWIRYSKTINGVKKVFWPITSPILKKRHHWRKQKSWFQLLYYNFSPPDVTFINMSGNGSPFVFKLGEILYKKRKPYIAMVGGMHMSTVDNALNYYQKASHIIVHTNIQKAKLKELTEFKHLDIRVVPLGIDTKVFKPLLNENRNKELLFVGRISRLKQIELAILSVSNLINQGHTDVKLNIIGPISNKVYYGELINMLKQLDIEDHVVFKGSLPQESLLEYYQQALLLLLPSKHESFGMVMVEAMSCGMPVIALKGAGGPDELIENAFNGMLCKKDDFNIKVLEVINNEELWKNLSKNARQRVLERWSLDNTINCFQESIQSALK